VRAGALLECGVVARHDVAHFYFIYIVRLRKSSKTQIKPHKTLNTKVVEKVLMNIFVKADLCSDQWFEHEVQAKLLFFMAVVNS
jgi:hypothetical protein